MDEDLPDAAAHEELPEGATEPGPNVTAMQFWDEVMADMEATAEEYREEGWEVVEIHTGDATVLTGDADRVDRVGLDVLVPGDEYERAAAAVADGEFGDYRVFRSTGGGLVFVLVATEDAENGRVILYPAYYSVEDPQTRTLLERAVEEGVLRVYLRTLQNDFVELTHADPEPFVPDVLAE